MMLLIPGISELTLRLLALSLLHFLWQGAALAALAYVAMAVCRSAAVRYTVGVATLGLMLATPVLTFVVLRSEETPTSALAARTNPVETASAEAAAPRLSVAKRAAQGGETRTAPAYFPWLVELWFAGVVVLSLRSAGGILLVERLRLRETTALAEEVLAVCTALERRMGLTRVVRYCESLHLDAPAVAGWIRPVVLLPMSVVSGLTEAQLEAVIAHELAHIRRYDALVNLFHVGVETLLFYHPSVWWLGQRVRVEREHCCDDEAVALCGSAVTYARALTHMAESKSAPRLAMAINRSPLVARVARLLGAGAAPEVRGASLSAGVLCLSAALLAGSALLGSVHHVQAQTPAPALALAQQKQSGTDLGHLPPAPPARARHDRAYAVALPAPARVPAAALEPAPSPTPSPEPRWSWAPPAAWSHAARAARDFAASIGDDSSAPAASVSAAYGQDKSVNSNAQSYIDSLNAVGLTDLTVDQLIGLKVQGVTADYIQSMKGYIQSKDGKLDVDEIIGMKVQGITGDYIKEMKAATGNEVNADEAIGMKVQGITPEYIKEMRALGLKVNADEAIGMKVQGITPEYVKEMRALGLKVDADDLIGMKVQGVTSAYVKEFNDLAVHPTSDELIAMKVQGVTPEYFKELQAAGFKVDADEAIGAKEQGVTPEFIAKVRSHGFKDLTLEKLIALKQAGVFNAEK